MPQPDPDVVPVPAPLPPDPDYVPPEVNEPLPGETPPVEEPTIPVPVRQ